MTFEVYWAEVEKLNILPYMAIKQIPSSLSTETKNRLMRKSVKETVDILEAAIDEINNGSVMSIDSLVKLKI